MPNPKGIIHALRKKLAKQDLLIEELGSEIGDIDDSLTRTQNLIRALKDPTALVDGAPMTIDRFQLMENGDIRVIPPPPSPDTCTQGERRNGKKEVKDLADVSAS